MIRYASDTLGRSFVLELLSLNNETTLSVAFAAMAEAPRQYDDQIRLLLEDNATIGIYLRGDVEFFFLKMLRAWYETLMKMTLRGISGLYYRISLNLILNTMQKDGGVSFCVPIYGKTNGN